MEWQTLILWTLTCTPSCCLRNMKWMQTNVPDPPDLTKDDMNDCFRKWSEWTLTSPSNLHLSIHEALLKHLQKPKDDNENDDNDELVQCGKDVMSAVFLLLKLAVCNTHVFKHWETIWNLFLEKEMGNPKIHHLHTIHIMEADCNLSAEILWLQISHVSNWGMWQHGQRAGWQMQWTWSHWWSSQETNCMWQHSNDATACWQHGPWCCYLLWSTWWNHKPI